MDGICHSLLGSHWHSGLGIMKLVMIFNGHGVKEERNILLPNFNGHADDKTALRKAALAEARAKGWDLTTFQGIRIKPNIMGNVR